MKIKLKKKTLIIIGISILALLVIVSIINTRKKGISVREVKVENRKVQRSVSANGTVESKSQANLAFSATGTIRSINVVKGDFVKKGAILAQINSSAQIGSAQAAKDARDIALRNKDLFVESSNDDYDYQTSQEYKIQIRKYDELISQAEATYKAQTAVLSNYNITAPFDGTVLDVSNKPGEVAVAGATIIQLANLESVYFEIDLDQEDFGVVKEGQEVEIHLDSYDNQPFIGNVSMLTKYAQTTSSGDERFLVEIEIKKQEDKTIALGMTGDCNITVSQTAKEVASIDYDAIFLDEEDKSYVWILDMNKLQKAYVEIGLEGDLFTEIKTDLSSKTVVAPINGKLNFKEGLNAKVVER